MPATVRRRPGAKKRIRDIRKHMIQNDQTDVNKFEYEYKPYPRILKDEDGKTLRDDEGRAVKAYDRAEELALCKEYKIDPTKEHSEAVEETDGDEEVVETKPKTKKKGK